jgi:rfaE bifunctional protein kinase chain/domain/rfaE bifunctional protein nucleotidyltransferase chain/domain
MQDMHAQISDKVKSAQRQEGRTSCKIVEIETLATLVGTHRESGKKVVLCHGVFDLLHIGHIKHFEQAKANGDILIVTITADEHVRKGPLRPAFPQALRAEALAALACVDYVAINYSPMAIELIERIRPDFYVKGSDYKADEKDVTGGIALERAAIEGVGGRLVFTDDIVFSSSTLINRYMPTLTKEASEFLSFFSRRFSIEDVVDYIDRMKALKVLIVGEAIVDEYHYCQAIGKSSKEPTLVLKQLSTEQFAGGVLAVANNIEDFCQKAAITTVIGDREQDQLFIHRSVKETIDAHVVQRENSPTITKTRYIDNASFSKLLEIYNINDTALSIEENEALCRTLEATVPQYDIVIVVDYGHSMLTEKAAQIISDKARYLAVNVQSNAASLGYQTVAKYKAHYVCITENEARLEARDRTGPLEQIIVSTAQQLGCQKMVVTRGRNGCICYSEAEGFSLVPALAGNVVDTVGAGDAFLALTSMAAGLGAPNDVLGLIGNIVAAQAVGTVGHRESISRVTAIKFINALLK